jgi:acetyl-CoA C-acetyltransferase
MTALKEVFVVSAVRTAIGTYGGSLKDTPLAEPRFPLIASVMS